MRASEAVARFLGEALRVHQISDATERKYRADLEGLVAWVEIHHSNNVVAITPERVKGYFVARSNKGLSAATLSRIRGALTSFAYYLLRERLVAEDPMRLIGVIRVPQTPPRPYALDVRSALLALPLEQPDVMIRGLLYGAGLRVSEVADLRVCDVDLGSGSATGTLTVRGKGSKTRVIPLEAVPPDVNLWALLHDYLAAKAKVIPLGGRSGEAPLIARPNGRAWNAQMVRRRTRAWAAMLEGAERVTPHRFRHSYATAMLSLTGNLRVVQELMGHQSIATTEKYTEVTRQEIRRVVRRSRESLPVQDSRSDAERRTESS